MDFLNILKMRKIVFFKYEELCSAQFMIIHFSSYKFVIIDARRTQSRITKSSVCRCRIFQTISAIQTIFQILLPKVED